MLLLTCPLTGLHGCPGTMGPDVPPHLWCHTLLATKPCISARSIPLVTGPYVFTTHWQPHAEMSCYSALSSQLPGILLTVFILQIFIAVAEGTLSMLRTP